MNLPTDHSSNGDCRHGYCRKCDPSHGSRQIQPRQKQVINRPNKQQISNGENRHRREVDQRYTRKLIESRAQLTYEVLVSELPDTTSRAAISHLLLFSMLQQCGDEACAPFPAFERRVVQIDCYKNHLPEAERGVHNQRPSCRRSRLVEQDLPADVFQSCDQRPIPLEYRIVERQLRFREILQPTSLAKRIDFDQFTGNQSCPWATGPYDLSPPIPNTHNNATAKKCPLHNR